MTTENKMAKNWRAMWRMFWDDWKECDHGSDKQYFNRADMRDAAYQYALSRGWPTKWTFVPGSLSR